MTPILAKDAWGPVAKILGLPQELVRSAVITFGTGDIITAEVEMFAGKPSGPTYGVWGTVAAGSAPFDS
jgi:hypothetical protein